MTRMTLTMMRKEVKDILSSPCYRQSSRGLPYLSATLVRSNLSKSNETRGLDRRHVIWLSDLRVVSSCCLLAENIFTNFECFTSVRVGDNNDIILSNMNIHHRRRHYNVCVLRWDTCHSRWGWFANICQRRKVTQGRMTGDGLPL